VSFRSQREIDIKRLENEYCNRGRHKETTISFGTPVLPAAISPEWGELRLNEIKSFGIKLETVFGSSRNLNLEKAGPHPTRPMQVRAHVLAPVGSSIAGSEFTCDTPILDDCPLQLSVK
jgi:hypothetical protein